MMSSRLVLIFLGFIFLIIVVLSSSRIAGALRERFGRFFPSVGPTAEVLEEITPLPTIEEDAPTPSPTVVYGYGKGSTPTSEIPATGPNESVLLTLLSSLLAGVFLKRLSPTPRKK